MISVVSPNADRYLGLQVRRSSGLRKITSGSQEASKRFPKGAVPGRHQEKAKTIPIQFPRRYQDHIKTVPIYSANTVSISCQYGTKTVLKRYQDGSDTIRRQCQDGTTTISKLYQYGINTVLEDTKTIPIRYQESTKMVLIQYYTDSRKDTTAVEGECVLLRSPYGIIS